MPTGPSTWSSPPAIPAAAPSPQLFKSALRGIRRYWWIILGLWPLLSVAACAAIYLKIHPQYESQSYIRVEDPTTLFKEGNPNDLNVFLETLVQLIQSNNVLSAAAKDQEVQNLPRIRNSADPVIELRKVLFVNKVPGTFLISVAMMSEDPREAAMVVNAVVEAFIRQNRLWSDSLSSGQKTGLATYLEKYKEQAKELEARWLELVKKGDADTQAIVNGAGSGGDGEKSAGKKIDNSMAVLSIEQFKNAQEKYREAQIELATAELNHNALLNRKPQADLSEADKGELDAQVRMIFQREQETVVLREKLFELQDKIKRIRSVGVGHVDPAEKRLRNSFEQTQERFEELWREREPQIRAQLLSHQMIDPQKEIRESQTKLDALRARMSVLESQTKNLKTANTAMATDTVKIAMIREELESVNLMRDTLQRKLDDIEFTSKDGSRVRKTNEAVPAGKPRSDNRMKYLAATPVGILFAILGLVVALELRSGRVSDPESLSVRMRHEVFPIAPLPNIRVGEDGRTQGSEQKLARFVQSLDHLRVALCEGGHIGQGRCVLITSATGGEGKTTLSAHLAARCANAGTSILLIDADMRRASLGRLLDVVSGPGLADVLNGDISLADALRPIQAGGFSLLSAGTTDIDPSRILTSSRVSALIEQLRASYDLILIDSPPILPVPDALLLGRYVDGVVMASRFDSSRLPLVEKASRQLAAAGIPILGMVVNGARGHSSNYDNYHYNYPNPANRVDDEPTPA